MDQKIKSAGGGAVSGSAAQTGMQPGGAIGPCGALAPLPLRTADLSVAELIDLYMAHYAGRDPTRVQRLSWWRGQLGSLAMSPRYTQNKWLTYGMNDSQAPGLRAKFLGEGFRMISSAAIACP